MSTVTLLKGDCLQKLKELKDNSIDSVVTDPPYEIGFMGKGWDDSGIANNPELWKEILRVLKPGGHLLSFSHSRTYHRQAVAVEDAGFEIRDQIMWIYGSGFPKSHNIGKSVDKLQGNEREFVGLGASQPAKSGHFAGSTANSINYTEDKSRYNPPVTKGNSEWEGWGTALKPAHEPIVMARKPFKGSVAGNVLEWGTGGINIDECRVGNDKVSTHSNGKGNTGDKGIYGTFGNQQGSEEREGRFPANIIFECTCENPIVKNNDKEPYKYKDKNYKEDGFLPNVNAVAPYNYNDTKGGVIHTDPNCPCRILDEQSGITKSSKRGAHNNKKTEHTNTYTPPQAMYSSNNTHGDTGGASRFFYCPKSSKKDRDEGLNPSKLKNKRPIGVAFNKEDDLFGTKIKGRDEGQDKLNVPHKSRPSDRGNIHPTVKPSNLTAYLVRLVTPKGGVVLDPFMGSGSTGKAAVREGFDFIGIEREDEYMEIAKTRIEYEQKKNKHTQFFNI